MIHKNRINEEILPGKKNQVIRRTSEYEDVVLKKFSDPARFQRENDMIDLLQDSGLLMPRRLNYDWEDLTITYSYVDGEPVVELIEDADQGKVMAIFTKICHWLVRFYSITRQNTGVQYILGDIHLRNFIYQQAGDQLYGLDFEECRPGRMESDVARLWVFILNYQPPFTERKKVLATLVKETLFAALPLDEELFQQETERETEELIKRRGTRKTFNNP